MSRPRKPVVSLLDRAIQYVSPAWAHSRHVHRVQMAMTGGYAGASYSGRLENWMPGQGDANADQIANLADLRGRSRDLVRNSPVAGGAAETAATYVIGAGLVLQSRINAAVLGLDEEAAREWQDQAESRFNVWSGSTLCDAVNEQVFADLQDLAWRSQWESGDVAVVLTAQETPGWPFRLALQIVEADRVSNPGWQPDTPSITAGMEYDSTGRLVAVHVCSEHPGAHIRRGNPKWTRITCRGDTSGRRNVLFLKRKLRPGQVRGIPEIAPIIGTLKQMDRYSDAEIDAAVNSALQAIFVKMDSMAFQEVFDPEAQTKIIDSAMKWGGGITGGRAINLLPGESVESPTPGRPNPNFDPFMSAFMGYVGMGLNIPKEVLMKHFQSSYSAARAALMDAWRSWRIRRARFVRQFCQPIYEEWLSDEVAAGRISAPGFFADVVIRAAWCGAVWSGDGPGELDPLKEAKATTERLANGSSTLADECLAKDGSDWQTKHAQRAREVAMRRAAGLEADPGQAMRANTIDPADPTDPAEPVEPGDPVDGGMPDDNED